MNKIQTEIWVPSKEHPGCVEYKGQRNAREVYTDIRDLLKAEDLMPDEYFIIGNKFDNINVDGDFDYDNDGASCFSSYILI